LDFALTFKSAKGDDRGKEKSVVLPSLYVKAPEEKSMLIIDRVQFVGV
jgi:hypothetical protein